MISVHSEVTVMLGMKVFHSPHDAPSIITFVTRDAGAAMWTREMTEKESLEAA